MISDFKQIEELFKEIDQQLKRKVHAFIIGGAALLYHGLKPSTKDIDLIVENKDEFIAFEDAVKSILFEAKAPTDEYKNMDLNQILVRNDFRIDLFHKSVFKKFSLSKDMIQRAEEIFTFKNIKVSFCANEDIFLFKTMTQRPGDLVDCISLVKRGIDWDIIKNELIEQLRTSGQDVWITWIGERLDILIDKGINIPIMKEVNRLRYEYFKELEKRLKNK